MESYEMRAIEKCFEEETESMASPGFLDSMKFMLRRNALYLIYHGSKAEEFNAFIPYLAINYFDRFLSRNPLPALENDVQSCVGLLAICCLSLAWKTGSNSFRCQELLNLAMINGLHIHRKNVLKLELLILKKFRWRLRAVTAVTFVRYFFSRIPCNFKRRTINEIVVQAQGDMKFINFKPSVIAAAAFLATRGDPEELAPEEFRQFREDFTTKISDKLEIKDLRSCAIDMHKMCKVLKIEMEEKVIEKKVLFEIEEEIEVEEEPEDYFPNLNFDLKWKVQVPYPDLSILEYDITIFHEETPTPTPQPLPTPTVSPPREDDGNREEREVEAATPTGGFLYRAMQNLKSPFQCFNVDE